MSTLHDWIQSLFPDIPRLSEDTVEEKFLFRHSFTEAITMCEFRRNEVCVGSDHRLISLILLHLVNH